MKSIWNVDSEKTEEKKQEQRLSKLDNSKDLKNNSSLKRISVNEIKEESKAKETKWVSPSIWQNDEIKEEIESSAKDDDESKNVTKKHTIKQTTRNTEH